MTAILTEETNRIASVERLVAAAQRGSRKAFGRLVERYQRAVYLTALKRLGNHAEAQELCQEVFLQAMRKIGQLRDGRCFGGWLRSITNRMAINRATRRGPEICGPSETFERTCVETATPLSTMLSREEARQVRLGLQRLGKMDRQTLVAFYFQGRSLIEMSEQFASPVGTIKRRLHVARKRLARELESLV